MGETGRFRRARPGLIPMLVAATLLAAPSGLGAQALPEVPLPPDAATFGFRILGLRDAAAPEDRRAPLTQRVRRVGNGSVEISFESGGRVGRSIAQVPFLALPPDVVLDASSLRPLSAGRVGEEAAFLAARPPSPDGSSVQFAGRVQVEDRRRIQTPLGSVEVVVYVSDTQVSTVTPRGERSARREVLRRWIVPSLGITVRTEATTEPGNVTLGAIGLIESIDLPPALAARSPFDPQLRVEFMPSPWEADALAAAFACRFEIGLAGRLGRHCTVRQTQPPGGRQQVWRIEIEETDSAQVQRVTLGAWMDPAAPRPPLDAAVRLARHYGFEEADIAAAYARGAPARLDGEHFVLTLASTLVVERRR